ncbi:FAD-dependent monooxygenase [Nocardia sp. NPDC051052]|uniref:FAD-dependent monooxygenase n=1 Tax=Nocardia sp. NPDC051052 TaxID=3364322 RepID=UPI0037AB0721
MSHIVIVGGGIGGLAAALSVVRKGHRATVLERGDFAELGLGIQLAPNGISALDGLGLGGRIREIAVHVDELRFFDGVRGQQVASMPLTETYRARFGHSYVVINRGELYRTLLGACREYPRINLVGGVTAVGYQQIATTAAAVLDNGHTVEGDALIGADGVRSAIRRQLVGDGAPRAAGITVYRSIVPMHRVPAELRWNAVSWWAGPGLHFVHYPIVGGAYMNLAPSRETGVTAELSGVPVTDTEVLRQFRPLCETARRLLELGEDWKSWALVDRNPVPDWTDGRVTLLGDAAHPSLHYLAQGACQALEDAITLGDLLDCPTREIPDRLSDYCAQRREHTARIQLAARDSIRLWHPAGAAADARNAALSALSVSELHDHIEWLHRPRTSAAAGEQVVPDVPRTL